MEGKSVFISSVSRRDLARRRPTRPALELALPLLVLALLIAAALGVFIVARGGL
jgi:hypothetical protein